MVMVDSIPANAVVVVATAAVVAAVCEIVAIDADFVVVGGAADGPIWCGRQALVELLPELTVKAQRRGKEGEVA